MVRKKKADPTELMIVNDSPGEECRIAILSDGHLEELYSEHIASATNVGSIYKGRVTNVEPAIQAAFVDFGQGASGFLHISDLHPRYFPGKERTEQVGKKIPRKARPPIQEALRRGDEVLVQVLKEGLGTKGPTLTSYLSIPGRLLVLMPDMDRVGVSRKVEDEEVRRRARKLLDSVDLPGGFGFILRTAGLDQTKTALKRDVAYLMRLWKVMEQRIKKVGAPCELFTESDLLVRTIRDVLRPTIKAIIVDSDSAYDRVSDFLRVVAPRTSAQIIRYRLPSPIFHAFDIERQIELIHSREVPLPSGGKLVIDQTEALVAIDVNSGRSRGARDSETNAFQTNCEAVDEICRQLRLRDLGGLVVNDLIDMYQSRHRRSIEERMKENLRRDRAKTTVLRLSNFGVMEMTRQRMRPSLRKSHFVPCPNCQGHGEIKSAESIASDTVRHAEYLVQFDRVKRLELVCSPRVASVLLSTKRRRLVWMEDETDKRVDVRVSDSIAADRVDFYAYDDRNADVDIEQLPAIKLPSLGELEAAEKNWVKRPAAVADDKPRRRRRRRRGGPADATAIALSGGFEINGEVEAEEDEPETEPAAAAAEDGKGRRRSRRRRRRRRGDGVAETAPAAAAAQSPAEPAKAPEKKDEPSRGRRRRNRRTGADEAPSVRVYQLAKEIGVTSRDVLTCIEADDRIDLAAKNHMSTVPAPEATIIREVIEAEGVPEATPPLKVAAEGRSGGKRRSRRGGRGRGGSASSTPAGSGAAPKAGDGATEKKTRKKRSRGKRGGGRNKSGAPTASKAEPAPAPSPPAEAAAPAGRQRRSLYRTRRKLSAAEREAASTVEDR